MDYFNPGNPADEGAWTEQLDAEIYVATLDKEHEVDLIDGVNVEFFQGRLAPNEWWMKRTASDGTFTLSVWMTKVQFMGTVFDNMQKSGEFGDVTLKAAEFGIAVAAGV